MHSLRHTGGVQRRKIFKFSPISGKRAIFSCIHSIGYIQKSDGPAKQDEFFFVSAGENKTGCIGNVDGILFLKFIERDAVFGRHVGSGNVILCPEKRVMERRKQIRF